MEARVNTLGLVIFDCDGVLVDSEPLSLACLTAGLNRIGVAITFETVRARFTGTSMVSIMDHVARDYGVTAPPGFVEAVKAEFAKVEGGLKSDADLNRLKAEHAKLGEDIERGLVEAGQEAKTGMQAAVEQATWFWQDLFKVYVPRIMSKMGDVPIPR